MKKIEARNYSYKEVFTVCVDNMNRTNKKVGISENGEYILIESEE